jgi:hypothetical protein
LELPFLQFNSNFLLFITFSFADNGFSKFTLYLDGYLNYLLVPLAATLFSVSFALPGVTHALFELYPALLTHLGVVDSSFLLNVGIR